MRRSLVPLQWSEGDTVMICRHLFEQARAGRFPVLEEASRQTGPFTLKREDGSVFTAQLLLSCHACNNGPETDYIEEFVRGGKLHVADFCRGEEYRRNLPRIEKHA
jgi:hypothetical protein